MAERVAYPSVETILEVGGKKAPSGLPDEVVNRFAFLDHINGRPPLVEQWWFLDEDNVQRQLTPEEMAKLVGVMSRMASVGDKGFGEIMGDFFQANARLEHLKSIGTPVFLGEAKRTLGEEIRDESVDVVEEAIRRQDVQKIQVLVAQIMHELPEKYRQVLDLYFRQGFTHTEIGKQIGLSRSGVGLRVKNALQAARELLSKNYSTKTTELDFS